MTRNTKKPPIELIGATYADVLDEFCKKFDLSPTWVASIFVRIHKNRIAQIAVHVAIDSALAFAKAHPDKVVLHPPPPSPPLPLDQPRTPYVG